MTFFKNDFIKQKLIQTAIDEIATHGIQACNVRGICSKSDIGKSTFYNRFSDKDDLLINIREYLNFRIERELFKSWNEEDSFDECWYKIAKSTWDLCIGYKSTVIAGQLIKEYFHEMDNDVGIDELSLWLNRLNQEKAQGNTINMPTEYLNIMTLGVVVNLAVNVSKGNAPKIDDNEVHTLFMTIVNSIKK
ncbi:TetR/AcrR family transcriptional regulator [Vibrio neonatus]|uniref:TetR/AcrR family transcriptional regulator n=1 Tax=Vibrio neonatus TaxID=278860 RepID=UPI0021C460C8|nr:TetR/AcrR family transcriptional regulator [Vibrio neonatus]